MHGGGYETTRQTGLGLLTFLITANLGMLKNNLCFDMEYRDYQPSLRICPRISPGNH